MWNYSETVFSLPGPCLFNWQRRTVMRETIKIGIWNGIGNYSRLLEYSRAKAMLISNTAGWDGKGYQYRHED